MTSFRSPSAPLLPTLAHALRHRAELQPEDLAYRFLVDGEEASECITYAELHDWSGRIAAAIRACTPRASRVALLLRPGLAYIASVLGCWYAGCTAVPCHPPTGSAARRRIANVLDSCRPDLCLISSDLLERVRASDSAAGLLRDAAFLCVDRAIEAGPPLFRADPGPHALIQYTSGTTGAPRGVVLSHANVLANELAIQRVMRHDSRSIGVGWLPPHHDMGLIGLMLQPLFVGFPCTLFSPLDFVQRPIRWLRAIARYGGTTSGGPTFAYELCVHKTTAQEREGLDLRSWSVAFVGAEPIRPDVLHAFARTFEPHGFAARSFLPCYGLAEATLIVTARTPGAGVATLAADPDQLERGRLEPSVRESAAPVWLAGSGTTAPDVAVEVIDPVTAERCSEGQIGEICVSGPSVAAGYWQSPEETAARFGARIDAAGPPVFLRTGDLGALRGGELFVTGRRDDLLIVRGRNIHPEEVEISAERSHPSLRGERSAVFGVGPAADRIVVVQEVRSEACADIEALKASIRTAVAAEHALPLEDIALIRHGMIPRTSSGKVRRKACRAAYEAGELAFLDRRGVRAGRESVEPNQRS